MRGAGGLLLIDLPLEHGQTPYQGAVGPHTFVDVPQKRSTIEGAEGKCAALGRAPRDDVEMSGTGFGLSEVGS
jgi:hypothetical protein